MTRKVTVIDYGLGNIYSVSRAIEHFGAQVELTDRAEDVLEAERVILPGVGAFANGMEGLRTRGLVDPLRAFAASGRPFLGICLGMQMLLSTSEEFGAHEGLGVVPGKVVAIAGKNRDGVPVKIPHIGWNSLERPATGRDWHDTVLDGVREGSDAYFVHSFAVVPEQEADRLADTWHGDFRISAALQRGNVSGCQFHPEKSGPTGLRIIENFLACTPS